MKAAAFLLACIVFPFPASAELGTCAYFEALAFNDTHTGSAGGTLAHLAATCADVEAMAARHTEDEAVQAAAGVYMAELERVRAVVLEMGSDSFENPTPMGPGRTLYGIGTYGLRHLVRTSGLDDAEALWRNTTGHLTHG